MEWLALIGLLLALAGTIVSTLGVIGIVRARDPGVKIHAASMMTVVGLPLVLAGGALTADVEILPRALVVGLFVIATAPLSSHALARLDLRMRGDAVGGDGRRRRSSD